MKIVLQKYIADSGFCSRRKAEDLIRIGRVSVNGEVAKLGTRVEATDEIKVGNKVIKAQGDLVYVLMNKPEGYVCSNRRFKGEDNVFDLLIDNAKKAPKERLFVVGRLDKMSEGLVLLTNDGDLTYKLTHPKFEHEKEYIVQLKVKHDKVGSEANECGRVQELNISDTITKLKKGVDIGEGEIGKAKRVSFMGEGKFKITLSEGKNRQIRRMFEGLDFHVLKLQRIRIGSGDLKFELGKLKKGEWKYVGLGSRE